MTKTLVAMGLGKKESKREIFSGGHGNEVLLSLPSVSSHSAYSET